MTRALLALSLFSLAILIGCGGNSAAPGGGSSSESPLAAQLDKAGKLTDPLAKSRELVPLALKQFKGGDLNGSEKSMRIAAEAARAVPDAKDKAARLNNVAGGFGQMAMSEEVKKLLQEVKASIEEIHEKEARIGPLAELGANYGLYAKSQSSAEETLRQAEEIARTVEQPLERIRALNKVVFGWSRLENNENVTRLVGDSTELANGLEEPREKAAALTEVADILQRMKKAEAAQMFADAEAVADKIAKPESKAYALLNIADKLIFRGQGDAAKKLVDKADDVANAVKDASIRGPLQETIDRTRRKM